VAAAEEDEAAVEEGAAAGCFSFCADDAESLFSASRG
jgi:hypothetical protein